MFILFRFFFCFLRLLASPATPQTPLPGARSPRNHSSTSCHECYRTKSCHFPCASPNDRDPKSALRIAMKRCARAAGRAHNLATRAFTSLQRVAPLTKLPDHFPENITPSPCIRATLLSLQSEKNNQEKWKRPERAANSWVPTTCRACSGCPQYLALPECACGHLNRHPHSQRRHRTPRPSDALVNLVPWHTVQRWQ